MTTRKIAYLGVSLTAAVVLGLIAVAMSADDPVTGEERVAPAAPAAPAAVPPVVAPAKPAVAPHSVKMQRAAATTCMADMAAALKAIDAATKSIENEDTKTASTELVKAKDLLTKCNKAMGECCAKADAPTANKRCPILAGKIESTMVPENLTREYKDKKIGFCCAECVMAWDKLADKDKDVKLEAAMAPEIAPVVIKPAVPETKPAVKQPVKDIEIE